MADIRINALATTAASTASDDFIAVDGSANGTRKLSAYSPTFGGNLTVSGTSIAVGTALTSGRQSILGGAWIPNVAASAVGVELNSAITPNANQAGIGLYVNPSFTEASSGTHSIIAGTYLGSFAVTDAAGATTEASTLYVAGAPTGSGTNKYALHVAGGNSLLDGNLTVSGTVNTFGTANGGTYITTPGTAASTGSLFIQGGNASGSTAGGGVVLYGGSHASAPGWVRVGLAGTSKFAVNTSGLGAGTDVFTVDQAGNLTVSGTGNSSVAGTLLVATTINSSNGKLQLADHTTSAGGIGFGSDTSLYRLAAGEMALSGTGSSQWFEIFTGTTLRNQWGYASGNTYFDAVTDNLYVRTVAAKSIYIQTNSTTALTLDSSQNATFAGTIKPQQAATASAPSYVKGAIYFDTTLNKLRVGGATGWETITSV